MLIIDIQVALAILNNSAVIELYDDNFRIHAT